VYQYLRDSGPVTRREVLDRFRRDDETVLRSLLYDLTESGLVFATGSGAGTAYRAATDEELSRIGLANRAPVDELLLALVFSDGPIELESVERLGGLPSSEIHAAMERLLARGAVVRTETAGTSVYSAPKLLVPLGARVGWEAAIYDHFQAVVRTISQKLGSLQSHATDTVGGSTFTYEVWPGHPLREEVLGALARFRHEFDELRNRVRAFNDAHPRPSEWQRVIVYGGQSSTDQQEEENE
jgi:hypothetical protein